MKQFAHQLFVFFLLFIGLSATLFILARNFDYYILPLEERPFHDRYEELKPSGIETHGYGIIGTAMIIFGVTMYSSRKRIRALSQVGKIKYFLEFHIFLCLLGPALVLYHTTFKFGGLVAVSFWSMTAVVASGIVGRYLYVQIPKGIHGDELSIKELDTQSEHLHRALIDEYGLDDVDIRKLDALAKPALERRSILALLMFFLVSDMTRSARVHSIIRHLHTKKVDRHAVHMIAKMANERIQLLQRIRFLEELKNIFHYWHVIHLPFTIIMFAILVIHVGVAIAFGYTWIF
ncbi:MAG: hypothetical protein HYV29_02275 [Ignavibacteriales bacterium]|nr:hypothetical protein [Ignavibacteriales bacterium]